ncbi:Putative secreted protein [Serinicoccus hydrothermalis]|uniref:Secreted protein n=1 Tax=Serinicoccus hydrothermalis TaxID=1758689 RepID=A0A1B1NG90_9MICO|nr:Putative secreted protein [Serinicoccus hydrothermalis]
MRPDQPQDPAWQFLRRLGTAPVASPHDHGPLEVRGEGEVAEALRAVLRPTARTGATPGGLLAGPARPEAPRRVVLVHDHLVPVGTAREPAIVGRPVLPVVSQTARVVIGPWTGMPGRPCLHCLDLHRRDRDPGWPRAAAALLDPLTAPLPPTHPPEVLQAVTALVVLLSRSVAPAGPGAAHEVGALPPHLVVRRWPPHPGCPWHEPEQPG